MEFRKIADKKIKKSKVTISWEGKEEKINIICNFPDYNKKLTLKREKVNNNKIIHSIEIYVPPGKYLYQYEINGNIKIDYKKPNNGEYNIIYIFDNNSIENKSNKFIDDNSIIHNTSSIYFKDEKNEKTINDSLNLSETIINVDEYSINSYVHGQIFSKKLSNLIEQSKYSSIIANSKSSNSNNFSIKDENNIQTLNKFKFDNSSINDKSIENIYIKNKCIIVFHLGEDYLVPIYLIEDKNNVVKLKYIDINSEILVKKEDIVYKKIDNFFSFGNLTEMKNLNEFSILKNIQFRINTNRPFIFANNFLLLFNIKDNFYENKERDFFLYDFYNNYEEKTLFIINGQSQSFIHKKLFQINNYNNKFIDIYFKIIDRIKFPFLFIKFNHIYNVVPLFQSNNTKNNLYINSFIFGQKDYLINNKIKFHFSFSMISNLIENKNLIEIIKNIFKYHKEEKYIFYLIYQFTYKSYKYEYIFKLFILSLILNYNQYIPQNKNEKLSSENFIFYSNLFIIYLFSQITEILNNEILKNKNNEQIFLSFFNSFKQEESDAFLNKTIGKIIYYFTEDKEKNNFLSQFYSNSNEEIIKNFEQNLKKNEEEIIINLINDLKIKEFPKNMNLINFFQNNFINSKKKIEMLEKEEYKYIRQIYNINFNNFDNFIKKEKNIESFFYFTQLIEYINIYKKHNSYFREISISKFFKFFLPILCDIDEVYNPLKNKIYISKLRNYIYDLQTYEQINEDFLITNDFIMLNYKTYEILMLLLFSLLNEKIKIIQKYYLKKSKNIMLQKLRKQIIMIQKLYKQYLSKIYNSNSDKDKINLILRKYKGNDPMLILLIIKSQNTINNLKKELENKFNEKMENKNIQNSLSLSPRNVFSEGNSITQNELIELKTKINLIKNEYKKLVNSISSYEIKLNNLIKIINSNEEIKQILSQNGIEIN